MSWWRKFLALLGLGGDARVNIRARGIDVTLIGEPEIVRGVLNAVKAELESIHRARTRQARAGSAFHIETGGEHTLNSDSQVVLPSDLDEMDSPYAIPQHRPANQEEETPTDHPDSVTPHSPSPPRKVRIRTGSVSRATAPLIEDSDITTGDDVQDTLPGSAVVPGIDDIDGPEQNEVTAVVQDPSGGSRAPLIERIHKSHTRPDSRPFEDGPPTPVGTKSLDE